MDITAICRNVQIKNDSTSFLFENNPICDRDRWLLMLKEWNSWDRLNTAKHMVLPTLGT